MTAVKVKLWKDKAFLNGDFKELRRMALELPGFKKFTNDSLMFEPSGKNIEYLLAQNIEWSEDADKLAQNHRMRIKKEEIARKAVSSNISELGELDFQFKTIPFDHQKKAFMLSMDAEYYGYFMEMGTGKTKVVIDNGAYLFAKNKINCLMILAPNGVHSQWIREQLPTHMPEWCSYDSYIYRASDKNSLKEIDKIFKNDIKPDDQLLKLTVVAFNIDALSNEKGRKYIDKFLRTFRCMMVIDESVRIKTPGSLRAKAAMKFSAQAPYRRIMSGAPVTKGYEDLYSQLKFLHPDVLGFNSFYTFRNYHCIMGGFESRQIVGYRPNAIKELEEKIAAYTFRVTKKECLDLPDKIYMKRIVELTPEQEELYDKLEDELAIDMRNLKNIKDSSDPSVHAEADTALMSAITRMLRMQQVTCGHFVIESEDKDKKKQEIIDLPSKRIDTLMECVHEAQGKIIIGSRFIHDLKKISRRLNDEGIQHRTYHGEVTGKDRELAIEAFRNNPDVKVFLAQPASGGTGLNLAVADTVIYFSNDFNADTRWQSEDRAHRIGQKNNVTYIDFVSVGTMDEEILESLRNKKNLADALLDDPRKFIK
jgi:SNF2 family DNA or RNA helicase